MRLNLSSLDDICDRSTILEVYGEEKCLGQRSNVSAMVALVLAFIASVSYVILIMPPKCLQATRGLHLGCVVMVRL